MLTTEQIQENAVRVQNGYPPKLFLKNGQRVVVHSLGDGKEYPGRAVGLSMRHLIDTYIIRFDSPTAFGDAYPWECATIPEGCLRRETGKVALARFFLDECFGPVESADGRVERLTMSETMVAEIEAHFEKDLFDAVVSSALRASGFRGNLLGSAVYVDTSLADRTVKVLDAGGREFTREW